MSTSTIVSGIDPDAIRNEYRRRGLDGLSDDVLAAAVAEVISTPREHQANSFVLHAPLELEARVALLPLVAPSERELARLHLVALAAQYEASGPAMVEPPTPDGATDGSTTTDPVGYLAEALAAGDLDEADRAATAVATAPGVDLAASLVDALAPVSAAAAHAPIFLFQHGRLGPRTTLTPKLLRPLARELARNPTWRVRWLDAHEPSVPVAPEALDEVLRTVPRRTPDGYGIHPILMQVDHDDDLAAQLGAATGTATRASAQAVLRVAARSMLEDTPDHAPYGWSHTLTLPQALLGLIGVSEAPDRVLAMAATHVAAFRMAHSASDLEVAGPDLGPTPDRTTLATRAATSHDAHVVKYVLACFDAASFDPEQEGLYLAAAHYLLDWWAAVGDPTDPLA